MSAGGASYAGALTGHVSGAGRRFGVVVSRFHADITEQLLESIDVLCPDCENDLVQCRTKKGRIFYGCSAYPRCEWKSWSRPLGVACRKCGGMLLAKGRDKVVCNSCGSLWRTEELYAEVKV